MRLATGGDEERVATPDAKGYYLSAMSALLASDDLMEFFNPVRPQEAPKPKNGRPRIGTQ